MSKVCNLFLEKGSDFLVNILCVGINHEPLDLTGMCFRAEMVFVDNSEIRQVLECESDFPQTGWLRLSLPYHETESLPVGQWHYDIECTYNEKRRLRVLSGHLTVSDNVTIGGGCDYRAYIV